METIFRRILVEASRFWRSGVDVRSVSSRHATDYNQRHRIGDLSRFQLPDMKTLDWKNSRLKKIVAQLKLDESIFGKIHIYLTPNPDIGRPYRAVASTCLEFTMSELLRCREIVLARSYLHSRLC